MKYLLLLLLLLPTTLWANTVVYYPWSVLRVIDGDTVVVRAEFLPAPLKKELSVRIYGVDTPEKGHRAQCQDEAILAQAATNFTKQFVARAKTIEVGVLDWDKYGGRILGDLKVDGKSLRSVLLELGYARLYFGEKKSSWCGKK